MPNSARNRGIKAKDGEPVAKLVSAFARKADESTLGRMAVEAVILLALRSQSDVGKVLKSAAQAYKVDTDAIALKVKQEFAAKQKAKSTKKTQAIAESKRLKKTA